MNNFWVNISRYPRFFISSCFGLVLIILKPLKKLRVISGLIILLTGIIIQLVIRSMLGL